MFRAQLPRLFELLDLQADLAFPDGYFQEDFEIELQDDPLRLPVYACWEKRFHFLDEDAWNALKNEAAQYLTCRHKRRGWHQLFDILGQADAYKHLRDIGCSEIRFIPRSSREGLKTPDLEGLLDSRRVLCEVKTINISDAEVRARSEHTAHNVKCELDFRFFRKLQSDITGAKDQMHVYDATGEARHLVYISICFDDDHHKSAYFRQIDQYLMDNPIPEIEVVFSASR